MNLTCKTCVHTLKNSADLTGRGLLCNRRPPSAFPVMGPHGGIAGVVSIRPQVSENDTACGDYESELESML